MDKKLKTSELRQCVVDADRITSRLPNDVRTVAFSQVLAELLDNKYVDDLQYGADDLPG